MALPPHFGLGKWDVGRGGWTGCEALHDRRRRAWEEWTQKEHQKQSREEWVWSGEKLFVPTFRREYKIRRPCLRKGVKITFRRWKINLPLVKYSWKCLSWDGRCGFFQLWRTRNRRKKHDESAPFGPNNTKART